MKDSIVINALVKVLFLLAEHDLNWSASSVSMTCSLPHRASGSRCATWGDTKKYKAKAKDNSDPFRLMGFGHRVHKNFDPRAKIIKKAADEVLGDLGVEDPILEIAKGLEKEALEDQYFVDRKLYPNVDFYSGIIYRAMGIPLEMFTVMFALGRLPGWIAQWREMRLRKEPIGRPRQIYIGENHRSFVDLENR